MKDLSLHVLDIAQNSVSAGARKVIISVDEDMIKNDLTITIQDDGKGIPVDVLSRVTDPYFTSRTTRKVGMGIPLFKQNAEMAGGSFSIFSEPGRGTVVRASFMYDHIDRPPIGDMPGVIVILCGSNTEMEWQYLHKKNNREYLFNTKEVKEVLDGLSIGDPSIQGYLREMIRENLKDLTE